MPTLSEDEKLDRKIEECVEVFMETLRPIVPPLKSGMLTRKLSIMIGIIVAQDAFNMGGANKREIAAVITDAIDLAVVKTSLLELKKLIAGDNDAPTA